MDYKKSLEEFIRYKRGLSEDSEISISLHEIAEAWGRDVERKFKYGPSLGSPTYIDSNFLADLKKILVKLEEEKVIKFKFIHMAYGATSNTKKLISYITNLQSLDDKIYLEVKNKKLDMELQGFSNTQKISKNKFPFKLPAGTVWENFTIKFLDDENVFIRVKQFKHNASYKDIGFIGKGNNPNPSEAWHFLKVLAGFNGELTLKDPEARDKYKKQKELLAKSLRDYFSLDYDPFYPYRSSSEKSGNSYKIKITLIPPPADSKSTDTETNEDDLGLKEYLNEKAPQVNKE